MEFNLEPEQFKKVTFCTLLGSKGLDLQTRRCLFVGTVMYQNRLLFLRDLDSN